MRGHHPGRTDRRARILSVANNHSVTPHPIVRLLTVSAVAALSLAVAGCAGGTSAESTSAASSAASSSVASPAPSGSLPTGLPTPDPNLPPEWPAAIPGYQDGRLLSAVVSEDGRNVNGAWATESSAEDAWAAMDAALRSGGYVTSAEAGAGDQLVADDTQRSDLYVRDGYEVNVVVIPGDQTTVMVNGSAL